MTGLRQDSWANNCPATANAEFTHSGHPYQAYDGGSGSFYATNPHPAFSSGVVLPQYPPPPRPQQMQQVYQTSNEQNQILSYDRDVHQYGFNEYPPFHTYPDGKDPRTTTYSIHSSGSTSTINTTCTSSSHGSASSPHIHRVRRLQPSPHPYVFHEMDSFPAMGYSPSSYPVYSPPTISPDARFNGSDQFYPGDTYHVPATNNEYLNYGVYQPAASLMPSRNPSSLPIPIPPSSTVRHSGALIQPSSHDTRPVQPHHHYNPDTQYHPPQAQPLSSADHGPLPPSILVPALPSASAQQQSQEIHPFSEHNGDQSSLNRPRRPWPSKFEEQVFTPEDMRLPAVRRRRIYINSLEQYCNQIHGLLKAQGLLTASSPQHIQDIVSAAPQTRPTSGKGKRPGKRGQNTKLSLIKIQHEMDALRARFGSLTESLCKQSSSPQYLSVLPNVALSPHPFSTTHVI